MLRREQKIRNIILFTLFSLVFIGVGYAVISSNLTLNGSMRLNKITWDVHFENFEELYDNTVTATKTLSNNNTTLTYNVNLNKPGDIFEFTIDVVNNGNIDAMLSNIGKNGLTAAQQQVMDYNVTYLDGTTPTVKDSLKIGEVETFVISVKTKANITNAQLNATDTNLSLTFNPTYAQDDKTSTARPNSLYSMIAKNAVLDNISSTYVTSSTGINYAAISSDTNGKGIYTLNSTSNNNHPIYFYRGNITNNYIKIGNFCWRILRTTESGGIKLVYSGTPDSSGYCSSTGALLGITSDSFNTEKNTLADHGYMYGTKYPINYYTTSESHVFGNSVTYANGKYTLVNTETGTANIKTHHYTCRGDFTTCTKVYYVNYIDTDNSRNYYITLENGKKITDAINEMNSNINSSLAKNILDAWYINNLTTVSKYIDDAIYCNDRNFNTTNQGFNENGEVGYSYFKGYNRALNGNPSTICNNKNDSFTVFETNTGNGALKYPIGLINSDELVLAGLKYKGSNDTDEATSFMNVNQRVMTMTPLYYKGKEAFNIYLNSDGSLTSGYVNDANKQLIRPVIALKQGIKISSGDGTQNNPYIVN